MTRRRLGLMTIALTAVAACAASPSHQHAGPAAATPGTSTSAPAPVVAPAPARPVSTSPLSGRAARPGLPVLVVKVDNVPGAFPQAGLNDADLVYVEEVEGGLTRLTSIFSSVLPRSIGPVRSARTDNIQLLEQFGRPDIAFSGANAYVLRAVRDSVLRSVDFDLVPGAYTRMPGHVAPHNLFVSDPQALIKAKKPDGAKFVELHFATGPVAGGRPAHRLAVHYPSVTLQFDHDAVTNRWSLTQDGQPQTLIDGHKVQANNVIVQSITQLPDPNGHITPFNQTIGGGPSQVLRDGKVFAGTWRRFTNAAGTHYRDAAGKDVPLEPGVTWIVLLPPGATASVG